MNQKSQYVNRSKARSLPAAVLILSVVLIGLVVSLIVSAPATVQAEDACPWMNTSLSADQRARLLLDASTLEQKTRWLNEQAANNPTQTSFSGGSIYPAQVPCTPLIQYTDGPAALSGAGNGITAFPTQIALAASWDQSLAFLKGKAHAWEAFNKQRNVILGPGLATGRTPLNGRNSEYLGEDPLLGGLIAASHIQGIQDRSGDVAVEAVLKHYVANEQETNRTTSSSNMDERTLHELYTLPYEIAIKQGDPGGIMCAFNQVNGVYSCENATILRDILKGEIGFGGWVVTDFGAIHSLASTPPSLPAGLDQELNRPRFWTPTSLNAALTAGTITEAQIDEAAFRVVRAHIKHGLFDVPRLTSSLPDVSTPEHQALAQRLAEEGSVLLKNEGEILPISGTGLTIAVIGQTASNTPTGGISAATVCAYNRPGVPCTPVSPLDGITARAALDGNSVVYDNGSDLLSAASTAQGADIAIVFGYYVEGEFNDRPNISLDGNGDALISAVAAANPNTVVILQTGGPVVMPWIDQVSGILEVWYAGVRMGNATAALLWGDVNPSGKLPQTFPVSEADLPTAGSAAQYPGILSGSIRQVDYSEGLLTGYRWYDAQNIEPLFPFGYGLSYTTFSYSHLQVTPVKVKSDKEIRVKFRVTNTGSVAGTEVAQVYLSLPAGLGEPPQRLVGWANVTLEPGQHENVTVVIDPLSSAHPLSYWNSATHSWVIAEGTYQVHVGTSSRDVMTDTVTVRNK